MTDKKIPPETVEAVVVVELYVTCPSCDDSFDLIELTENEEGHYIEQARPNGCWATEHDKFEETVSCPECRTDINVKRIPW